MSNVGFSQALLGNKWESCDAPDWMAGGLCEITAALNEMRPDENCGGGLGGSDGYGQDFENEVFVMFPYFWGDCECGFEERDIQWSRDNKHRSECYQRKVKDELRLLGWKFDEWDCGTGPGNYDDNKKAEERTRRKWCAHFGLPYPNGCAVHCTCDHNANYQEFRQRDDHAPTCGVVRPNFLHKKSGLAVHWYKYIGRGMTANRQVGRKEWRAILNECLASLESGAERRAEGAGGAERPLTTAGATEPCQKQILESK